MKVLGWLVIIVLAVIAGIFAAFNDNPATVHLWPADTVLELPVFVLVLACLTVGFVIGVLASWVAGRRTRRKARSRRKEVRSLQRQLDTESGEPAQALPTPRI